MKKIKTIVLFSLLAFTSLQANKIQMPDILKPDSAKNSTQLHSTFRRKGPTIQIGILLDTSSSMDGLINQAREQLWKIVNEVAKANKDNKDVIIQVGLFEYGKSSLPSYEGYLQMLTPLTSDLDLVSEKLFALRTNGGEEYAGKVILEAVNRFAWSTHKDDLKLFIVAGNESFAQGSVPFAEAIKKAKNNGIIVNTIFCGDINKGRELHWYEGAKLGAGKYFNINQNDRRVYIATPYDDEIIMLGQKLNNTYMNYGKKDMRIAKKIRTRKQDSNSKNLSKSAYIERSLVKAKKQYAQASLDMVSAYMQDKKSIAEIRKDELPDEFKDKSKEEIEKIVEKKKEERIALQKKIKELEVKRAKHISAKSQKSDNNLGSVVVNSIRIQAEKNGFTFKD